MLLALATLALAGATVRMESAIEPGVTDLWVRGPRASGNVVLHIVMQSTAEQIKQLEKALWDVSDPDSPRYGQHLSQSSVDSLVAPNASAVHLVTAWLQAEGVRLPASDGALGEIISVELAASKAEELFETELHSYALREQAGSLPIIRASTHYTLPEEIAKVVLLVADLHGFPAPSTTPELPADTIAQEAEAEHTPDTWPTDCGKCDSGLFGKRVSPAVLSQRYGIPLDRTPGGYAGSIGVAEFQGVYYDQADLDGYATSCGLPSINLTLIGDNRPKRCSLPIIIAPDMCTEALLDIQVIKGIGPALPLTDVYHKGYSIIGWASALQAMPDGTLPLVQSVSYGNDEAQQASGEYMDAVNVAMMKLGARGVSVFFASGDGGVYGRRGSSKRFAAGFPASSPYVTAVGGTDFVTKNVIGDEKAWTGSGGGFSYHFAQPPYQRAAVAAYLAANATGMPDASRYNATGRGFPDISALAGSGNQYCIVRQGKPSGAYGTSAATPVIAAAVAKLNILRAGKGKPPLGFVNPLFYKNADAFHDVTVGCNGGKLYHACERKLGFPAVAGWDASTGLGTPDFAKLAAII